MQFADSHCHPHLAPLDTQGDEIFARARTQGVAYFLCVAVSLLDAPALQRIASMHPDVSISAGVHPNDPDPAVPSLEDLTDAARHPAVVAVGETGLDYFRSLPASIPAQKERFRRHIEVARALGKPLIIHTRDAARDTMQILREEGAEEVAGVMHCFTEDDVTARLALDLGFYISFSGIVTFRNATMLREVARLVPDDRLLIETDAPYLAPVPYRGKVNEPAFVPHVAATLAQVRGVSISLLAEHTTANYLRLFRPPVGAG